MMNKKDQKEFQRRLTQQQNEDDIAANLHRARSVTVGTAFGGVTELMMRKNDGSVVWAVLQPVEVMELIHQLSANIGCHINVQPRNDFASWRNWKAETPQELLSLNGHPPFASDINPHELRARVLPKPEQQPGLQPKLMSLVGQKQIMEANVNEEQLNIPFNEQGLKINE